MSSISAASEEEQVVFQDCEIGFRDLWELIVADHSTQLSSTTPCDVWWRRFPTRPSKDEPRQ